ncbi:MAG: thioredoxin family protein [Saprospiraceae bacterium]|nr:thioredoxin family protein [Saprospiraceae bacterium]
MKKIDSAILEQAIDYTAFRQMTDELIAQNKTTGDNQSEAMLHYTKMNGVRMKRLDKTTKLTEEAQAFLEELQAPQTWLVLTEAWCGDGAQIIPVMAKMADASALIDLKIVMRDEHPELMDAFLTNGARSIPKLIVLDTKTLEVLGSWGPRPAELQQMLMDAKEKIKDMHEEAAKEFMAAVKTEMQRWYAKDKTIKIQRELAEAMQALLVS